MNAKVKWKHINKVNLKNSWGRWLSWKILKTCKMLLNVSMSTSVIKRSTPLVTWRNVHPSSAALFTLEETA